MKAIETEGLTRRFGEVVAVEDLTMTVEAGEVYGFLGPNGAGKSTTIDVLLGFTRPSSGHARVLGHDVTSNSLAARRRIGLLPEGYELYRNLTGREQVASAIETKGADDDPDRILERVGLDPEDARRPAGEYSTGMAQRLALGVALVGDPDLLVLDEPSSGLDPKGIKLLRRIVREEAERGATVFFSSHHLDQVERVCDRVGILHDGELVAENAVEDLRSELGAGATVEAVVDPVPDPADLSLSDVEGVGEVRVDGSAVQVECLHPGAKMPALRQIDDLATVEDVVVEDASLESVFERYTADAGAAGADGADAAGAAGTGNEVAAPDGGDRP